MTDSAPGREAGGPPCVVVAGPTASGKTALARDAALALGGVVINADSMQVYRELAILSARPTPADEAAVPHRLFGILSIAEICSAGRWLELAHREIAAAAAAGRLPIVVGGSGLYLKALLRGLAPVPPVPAAARAEARALYRDLGGAAFRDRLAARDPVMAARLMPGDRQRLIRAYEVVLATGRSLADWQKAPASGFAGHRFATIVLLPPRDVLYRAIEARFDRMIANGALGEVASLARVTADEGNPALKALGVRELRRHLDGEIDLETAVAQAKKATRHYAKRQMTWLRHQILCDAVFSEQYSESLRPKIFSFIRQFLLTSGSATD